MGTQGVCAAPLAAGVEFLMRTIASREAARAAPTAAAREQAVAAADADRQRLTGLVAGMAARDEAALAAFYDATVARAYGMALRVTRNAALAEEVVADAYHQAWREAARYDGDRSRPLTWLLMICRSRALDALRARDPAVAHAEPETLVAEGDQACATDPQDLVAAIEASDALHAALARLTAAQRQMLALAFFRGCSHQEIAVQTSLPLGTVKSQIRRALVALRQKLAAAARE